MLGFLPKSGSELLSRSMAQPKVWLQTDGETTTVHTPFTTRAKDGFGRGVEGKGFKLDFCLEDFGSSLRNNHAKSFFCERTICFGMVLVIRIIYNI